MPSKGQGRQALHSTSHLVLGLHCPEKGHNLGQDSSLQTEQFLGSAEAVSSQQPLRPAAGNRREQYLHIYCKPKQHNIQRGNQYILINYLSNLQNTIFSFVFFFINCLTFRIQCLSLFFNCTLFDYLFICQQFAILFSLEKTKGR